MPTTWILSANNGRARFFAESTPAEPLQEIEDMINSAAQLRTVDTETDRLGPRAAGDSRHSVGGHQPAGFQHNAQAGAPTSMYQPAQTPDQHAADLFARDVAAYLLKAQNDGRYQQLLISASPDFLGVLRTKLDPAVQKLVKAEYNKDYTHSTPQQLREQLNAHQAKTAE
ncbi:host attachment protein [Massilia oculi]|uniref:Host attachment protein n=1 Tax=Massilia hydrophila TaxID=3044279 RepID=A0ABS7YEW9_9BURK|nr:host attachment protein [Massilia oculi]MCA1858255.1 host attachment protein [Massilia oculi]